ncbi:hypothetical protein D3C81_1346180 [compost metagenome]
MAGVNNSPPGCTITTTPTNPVNTESHWPVLTRSPNKGTDKAVTISGARKLTAVASANGMYCRPLMNSRLVPSKLLARNACSQGLRVCNTLKPERGRKIPIISTVWAT